MSLRLTEQPSKYNHLEKMSVDELITLTEVSHPIK